MGLISRVSSRTYRDMEKYKILGNIGEGAHGIVYKARNRQSGCLCALKKVALRKIEQQGFPVKVFREIKVLQHIRDVGEKTAARSNTKTKTSELFSVDPGSYIIFLQEAFSHGTGFILSFDFMVSDLSEVIRSYKAVLNLPQIKSYIIQITRGLQFIHNSQFLHRDLKP